MQNTHFILAALAFIGAVTGYTLFQKEKDRDRPGLGTYLAALWLVQFVAAVIGMSLVQWLGAGDFHPADLNSLPKVFWFTYTVWSAQALIYIACAKLHVMKTRSPLGPH